MAHRLVGWLLFTGGVMLVIITVSVLSGWEPPAAAAKWLLSGLPGWLQAITTGFAAWVAWTVWRDWRPQEIAKRKALQAPNLLREVAGMVENIHAARKYGGRAFEFPMESSWLKEQLHDDRRTRVDALATRLKTVKLMNSETVDERVRKELRELIGIGEAVVEALAYLDDLSKDCEGNIDVSEEEQVRVEESLRTFGIRKRHERDVLRTKIDAMAVLLEERLSRHIAFKD